MFVGIRLFRSLMALIAVAWKGTAEMKNSVFNGFGAWITIAFVLPLVLATGCGSASYVTNELSGGAKPEGGINEVIPATKVFQASPTAVREAEDSRFKRHVSRLLSGQTRHSTP